MAKETVKYKVIPIEEEPERKYDKGSKYDPIIDAFIKAEHPLSKIEVTKKDSSELLDGNYLRTQLAKRIKARELNVVATVINTECYLKR
jgi:hypothetical protein